MRRSRPSGGTAVRAGRRRLSSGWFALLAIAALLLALPVAAEPAAAADTAGSHTAAVVSNGAWCWFQDPRAVHHVGRYDRTYVGYVNSVGDVEVVSIDNGTGVLTQSVLHPKYQADDHAAPGIVITPNGTVVVFYSQHGGSVMNYRVSTRPEDVSSFGAERTLPTGMGGYGITYANPIYLASEGRTYLFFRGGSYRPTVTSTTDFVNWTPAQQIVFPDVAGATARPYAKYATNNSDTVLIAFDDGHPRDVPTNSVYTLTMRGGVFSSADGRPLATLDKSRATSTVHALPVHTNELTKVYDGAQPSGKAWIHSAALDRPGHRSSRSRRSPRRARRPTATTAITTRGGTARPGRSASSPTAAGRSTPAASSRTTRAAWTSTRTTRPSSTPPVRSVRPGTSSGGTPRTAGGASIRRRTSRPAVRSRTSGRWCRGVRTAT